MILAGLILLIVSAGLASLDFLGVTPGAAGTVNVIVVVSVGLLVSGGIQAAIRSHHLRQSHAHR